MPAWDLTPAQSILFGDIQRAVRERKTTAEIWQVVRNAEERLGTTLPEGAFRAVNEMRSIAASLRRASEDLARAGMEDTITAEMIGRTIYSRPPTDPSAGGNYHVRFSVPRRVGEDSSLERYTMSYDGGLPATVGELYDDLDMFVAGLAGDYGVALGDVQDVEIGAY